jgi:hypothetical protein
MRWFRVGRLTSGWAVHRDDDMLAGPCQHAAHNVRFVFGLMRHPALHSRHLRPITPSSRGARYGERVSGGLLVVDRLRTPQAAVSRAGRTHRAADTHEGPRSRAISVIVKDIRIYPPCSHRSRRVRLGGPAGAGKCQRASPLRAPCARAGSQRPGADASNDTNPRAPVRPNAAGLDAAKPQKKPSGHRIACKGASPLHAQSDASCSTPHLQRAGGGPRRMAGLWVRRCVGICISPASTRISLRTNLRRAATRQGYLLTSQHRSVAHRL